MPDELKPCPWCKSTYVESFPAHAASYVPSVLCHTCGRAVDAEDAVTAWNDLPRASQWVEFDGTEETLPPNRVLIIVESEYLDDPYGYKSIRKFNKMGRPLLGDNLVRGDRWMSWPGGAK